MWIFFALLAPALFAINNIVDKNIVSRFIYRPAYLVTITGLLSLPFFLAFLAFGTRPSSTLVFGVALLAGMLDIWALLFYYRALTLEETSRVVPLIQFLPVFVFILSPFTVGEHLTQAQIVGFVLIVAGGILVSLRKGKVLPVLSPAFFLILVSVVIWAIATILFKYVYQNVSFLDGFLLIRSGAFLGVLPVFLLPQFRSGIGENVKQLGRRVKLLIVGNEIVGLLGFFSFNFAISLVSASLVSAITGIQSLFVLIYATLLSIWFPKILQEEIKGGVLLIKVVSIILILAGIFILST